MKISLMITCLGDVIRPSVGQAAVAVLRRLGHEIEFPRDQTCCGQPMFNSGFGDLARQQAQHTIRVFEHADVVVTPSGSCAAMVKSEYPRLFAHDGCGQDATGTHDPDRWQDRSRQLAAKTFEFSEFLVRQLKVLDVGARYDGKVAYHYACHLRLLGLKDEAEQLIERVQGATLVSLPRQDQCCGFGGSFAVRYPQISGSLVDDKVNCVLGTDANALVSTDTGCLMNIGGRLRRREKPIDVMHIAELLNRVPS